MLSRPATLGEFLSLPDRTNVVTILRYAGGRLVRLETSPRVPGAAEPAPTATATRGLRRRPADVCVTSGRPGVPPAAPRTSIQRSGPGRRAGVPGALGLVVEQRRRDRGVEVRHLRRHRPRRRVQRERREPEPPLQRPLPQAPALRARVRDDVQPPDEPARAG